MAVAVATATATATAAVVLLAGCGGSDDQSSDSKPDSAGASSATTPSPPPIASFDPPKAFAAASAFALEGQKGVGTGMVGRSTLVASLTGVTGRDIAAQKEPWMVPAAEATTTETVALTRPVGVQLDGKDVVAIAYVQNDKGNGTQKAKGQVLFQWIDSADGKKVAEVVTDLTAALGPGEGVDDVVGQAYDAATGQVAIGLKPAGQAGRQKVGATFTVYADPTTQKSTVIPSFDVAGVLNGVVAGANGGNAQGQGEATILVADAATGKITKRTPTNQAVLHVAGHGSKRAYLSGTTRKSDADNNNTVYAVDIPTGAVVPIKGLVQDGTMNFGCLGDEATAVVCTARAADGNHEIIGIDDTTGKKAWGYTEKASNRVVPSVTAAFHGIIYAQTEAQPVLMDAATGEDVKVSTPAPPESASPTDGGTPGSSQSSDPSSQTNSPANANGSVMSLYDGKLRSPHAVTEYGGVYVQGNYKRALIALSPTA
ncbi:hypothetical protein E1218_34485 [Kribbella turkmenica]|uniref:Uncharacterized protein n=1 Tax=Kribbella turkmenica TaxID=2530375 RepID=A0A4R4WDL1_9ACTN|nr:hypothetical protein [Kribbella turkmenica]TDD13475.1 hypothetical protein E1218_34485 [Kribbella turkmenica]